MSHEVHAEILEKTAALLDEYGWRQLDLGDETLGFCSIGALNHVVRSLGVDRETRTSLVMALQSDLGSGVMAWNDRPGQTQEQVTRFFRGKARRLRNEA